MPHRFVTGWGMGLVALFAWGVSAPAEEVRLVNGDVLYGTVLSLDAQSLKLRSDNFGEMTIDRQKVAVIRFGDAPVAPVPAYPGTASPRAVYPGAGATPATGDPATGDPAAAGESPLGDDLAGQLRNLDPRFMKAIEQAFPLLNASPEARDYFQDRVGGLMSGRINVDEIRKDARKVVDELEELKADLGDEAGAALDGYLGILKRFLRETEPGAGGGKATTPPRGQGLELPTPAQLNQTIEQLKKALE